MRHGVRLAIDVGRARIGVARSDPDGLLALPLETVKRDFENQGHIDRIVSVITEYEVIEVICGYPLNLRGEVTASTEDALEVARKLAASTSTPIRLLDERLTTVAAASQFRASGKKASRSRDRIDQAAAVVILQDALDIEPKNGKPPGIELE